MRPQTIMFLVTPILGWYFHLWRRPFGRRQEIGQCGLEAILLGCRTRSREDCQTCQLHSKDHDRFGSHTQESAPFFKRYQMAALDPHRERLSPVKSSHYYLCYTIPYLWTSRAFFDRLSNKTWNVKCAQCVEPPSDWNENASRNRFLCDLEYLVM